MIAHLKFQGNDLILKKKPGSLKALNEVPDKDYC
jgi:hypothetical protein